MATNNVKIQQRVDTKENWNESSAILLKNEIAFESESGRYKIGDGVSTWSELPLFGGGEYSDVNNVQGSYAFTILDIDEKNKTYTLDGVEGLEIGDVYSANVLNTYNSSVSGDNVGKITAINGNVVTVDVFFGTDPKYGAPFKPIDNFIEDGYDKERNIFRIIAKPNVGTRKIGDGARANGVENQALCKGSNSDGNGNLSYGAWADTYGKGNKAGFCASAGGLNTHAKGKYSKTDGQGTITGSSFQYAHGKYNIEDENSEFAEIVGNGATNKRSNAYTLDWQGNGWFAGEVTVGKNKDPLMTSSTLIQLLLSLGIEVNIPEISNSSRIELEDYAGNIFDNNGAKMTAGISASSNKLASNGKWLNVYTMGQYDFTKVLKAYIKAPIMVLEDGYYNMSTVMNYRGTGWVSEITISIDGTKLLVNDASYVEQLPGQIFNANFSKAYKYNKNDIYLTRGLHFIDIQADRAKTSPTAQGILFAMDYIEFTKQDA